MKISTIGLKEPEYRSIWRAVMPVDVTRFEEEMKTINFLELDKKTLSDGNIGYSGRVSHLWEERMVDNFVTSKDKVSKYIHWGLSAFFIPLFIYIIWGSI